MTPTRWGQLALLGCAVALTSTVLVWDAISHPSSRRASRAPVSAHALGVEREAPSNTQPAVHALRPKDLGARTSLAEHLMERLLVLMQQASEDHVDEIARLRSELLALGESAAGPILTRLASEADTTRRDLLLDLLRSVPGRAAEAQLMREARSAAAGSSRSIAMDALAERGSEASLQALADIATTDPVLPSYPLIVADQRGVEDVSTELPDEVDYTPRMKAMVALASTEDDRAVPVLVQILQREREESLRMRAAEHLGRWQSHRFVLPALRLAATQDASRYVRLAALHALDGADDPTLAELLTQIGERDPDAGVRLLARRLLDQLGAPTL